EEARQLNNNYIGTEHLLLGLIREGDGLAARVLVKLGADLEQTRKEVYAMQEGAAAEGGVQGAAENKSRPVPAGNMEGAWRYLWEMPYAELRRLAEAARSERNPSGAVSAAMVAVDLARNKCGAGLKHLRGVSDLPPDGAWAILSLARVLKDTL